MQTCSLAAIPQEKQFSKSKPSTDRTGATPDDLLSYLKKKTIEISENRLNYCKTVHSKKSSNRKKME